MKVTSKSEETDKKVVKSTKKEGVLKRVAKKVAGKKEPTAVSPEEIVNQPKKAEPKKTPVATPAVLPELPAKPLMTAKRKAPKTICGGHRIAVCRLNARRVKLV